MYQTDLICSKQKNWTMLEKKESQTRENLRQAFFMMTNGSYLNPNLQNWGIKKKTLISAGLGSNSKKETSGDKIIPSR